MALSPHEDRHYHMLRLYSVDLSDVQHSLRVLRRYRRDDVRWCILRELIVAYARPFSVNRDELRRKHILGRGVVPKALREFHDYLLGLRNKIIAHTDFARRRPRVSRWTTPSGTAFPMTFWALDYRRLDGRVGEIEELVRAVEDNLNATIAEIELRA